MKHSILLLFLLVGLAVLDIACSSDSENFRIEYTITGIESTNWYKYKYSTRNLERIDSLLLVVDFESTKNIFQANNAIISTVFAESPAEIQPINSFDSILVYSNGRDYTSSFSFFYEDVDLKRLYNTNVYFGTSEPLGLSFGIKAPIVDTPTTLQFNLKFYDTEGNIFETTTEPVLINP
jgi:hypothetical protein